MGRNRCPHERDPLLPVPAATPRRGPTTADPSQNFVGGLPLGRSVGSEISRCDHKEAATLVISSMSRCLNQGCRCWFLRAARARRAPAFRSERSRSSVRLSAGRRRMRVRGNRVPFFPVDNVNALDTQRHFGEPIRRGKRDRREGRDDRLDRLAGLAYAASVRAFAAAGAEWVARPSVRPRRRSDSLASTHVFCV